MYRALADSMTLSGQEWTPRRCLKPLGANVLTQKEKKMDRDRELTQNSKSNTQRCYQTFIFTPLVLPLLTNDCFNLFTPSFSLLCLDTFHCFPYYFLPYLRTSSSVYVYFILSIHFHFTLPSIQNLKSYRLLFSIFLHNFTYALISSSFWFFFSCCISFVLPPSPIIFSPFLLLSIINRHWF